MHKLIESRTKVTAECLRAKHATPGGGCELQLIQIGFRPLKPRTKPGKVQKILNSHMLQSVPHQIDTTGRKAF